MSASESASRSVLYEDKRDEIVASFREELQKAGFSVQDEDIARVLDKRHQKIIRRDKTTPREQHLNENDIELLKQHRLLKKRLRSLCNELVVKRDSCAVKIQETAGDNHQAAHEAMLQRIQNLEEKINSYQSSVVEGLQVNDDGVQPFEDISQNWEKIQQLAQVIGDLETMQNFAEDEEQDSCDIQHIARETVVKASEEDIENDSLTIGQDYLPLVYDRDHEVILNNAKILDT